MRALVQPLRHLARGVRHRSVAGRTTATTATTPATAATAASAELKIEVAETVSALGAASHLYRWNGIVRRNGVHPHVPVRNLGFWSDVSILRGDLDKILHMSVSRGVGDQ